MTKSIILLTFFLSCSLSYAQYDWTYGKVLLKNGKTLEGLLKIPSVTHGLLSIPKTKLEYKKDKKGKKIKFDKTQVDKVFFGTFNPNVGYYEYVPVSKKRMALFKLVRNGKVKLYTRTIKVGVNTGFSNNDNGFQQKKVEKRREQYIIRKNENIATRVLQDWDGLSIASKGNIRSFKNYMKKYFSDCADVLSFIDDDLYQDFNVTQIVEDYNLLCD